MSTNRTYRPPALLPDWRLVFSRNRLENSNPLDTSLANVYSKTVWAKRAFHHIPMRGRIPASTANPVSFQNRNRPRWQPLLNDLTPHQRCPTGVPGTVRARAQARHTARRVHGKVGQIVAYPTGRTLTTMRESCLSPTCQTQKEKAHQLSESRSSWKSMPNQLLAPQFA